MFIPAFSILFIALVGLCGTFALFLLPVFPKSIWAKVIWLGFFALMSWIFVTEMVVPVEYGAWRTPPRSILVQGLIFFSPFALSLVLWRRNSHPNRAALGELTLFSLIAIACAVSFFGLQAFKQNLPLRCRARLGRAHMVHQRMAGSAALNPPWSNPALFDTLALKRRGKWALGICLKVQIGFVD